MASRRRTRGKSRRSARARSGARRRRRRRRPLRRWLVAAGLVLVATGGAFVWWLNREVSDFLAYRATGATRLYAAPFELRPGVVVEGARLVARLRRLAYREVAGPATAPLDEGTYRLGDDALDVALRPFTDATGPHPGAGVRLELAGGTVIGLTRLADGTALDAAALEPELIAVHDAGAVGERRPVRLPDLPPHVVAAVLAAEDARFAAHPGIDPVGIARAALVNLRQGAIEQGGSTITQQLAKNVFLSADRRWSRKALEAVLAVLLEIRLTKTEILEAYLNSVYVGRIGSIGLYGLGQAARVYYDVEPRDLSPAAAATIAGMLRAPNAYSPLRHPERARTRRDQVLASMAAQGWLEPDQLAAARAEPIEPRGAGLLAGGYFVDEILRQVKTLGYAGLAARGLAVYTTLDVEMQRAAERALARELRALEERVARLRGRQDPVEGAVVLVEARSGFVRALAGGRDFARSQFNRATRARRQPGSAFKPFVYLAALDDPTAPLTAASAIADEPLRQRAGGRLWTPANYDGRFLGPVTVRRALVESRNVPAVRVAEHAGLARVAALAESAGLGPLTPVPAMALGAEETSLLALVAAYTVFPNLGEVAAPTLLRGVVAADGTVAYRADPVRRRVASPAASYVVSHLLEAVVDAGTGRAVRTRGIAQPVGGKTGTTNDERDAWFVGFSPDLVGGAWVGFDDGTPVGLTGAGAALPVWASLMEAVLPTYEPRSFRVPPGVVFRSVGRATGRVDAWSCDDPIREAFVAGTEPAFDCDAAQVAHRAPPPFGRDARLPPGRPGRDLGPSPVDQVRGFFRRLFGGD